METIRILFYTDNTGFNEDPCNKDFGLYRLERLIELKTQCVVKVEIKLVNRHMNEQGQQSHAFNKLTRELLCGFDELWLFGYEMVDTDKAKENELTAAEVMGLERWMSTGGVLISGDHANCPGTGSLCEDIQNFRNLGRALGHKVPRAGQLRVWEGPPTAGFNPNQPDPCERDNFNTQVFPTGTDPEADKHQADGLPQELIFPPGPVHRLFQRVKSDGSVAPITVFPDHMHEGELTIPVVLNGEWPTGSPRPAVVARGTDKRCAGKEYDLVIAYDGHQANVGRIVADSSWHHYTNVNLLGIYTNPPHAPEPDSAADQIAQFYANLVLWLAPKVFQDRLGRNILFRVAANPTVMEVKGASPAIVGDAAQHALARNFGEGNALGLLMPPPREQEPDLLEAVTALALTGEYGDLKLAPSQQRDQLGWAVNEYHRKFDEMGVSDPGFLEGDPFTPSELREAVNNSLPHSPLAKSLSLTSTADLLRAVRGETQTQPRASDTRDEVTPAEEKE